MQIIAADFETYYDKEYSLRKMTPVEYILDPRFESIGMAVREGYPSNNPTYWVDGPDLQKWFDQAPKDAMYISHNALFDMCIASFRYGFVPKYMADTLGISRACLGHVLRSLSLKSVAQHLGLPAKGDTVFKVEGMGLAAIKAAGIYIEYDETSKGDADRCMEIFDKLVRGGAFPINELAVMDLVLRCAVKPRFQLDMGALAEHKNNIRVQKDQLLAMAMLSSADGKDDLMSNDRFATLLQGLGVDPPMKVSPVTGKVTYAFARTDPDFIDLQEHDDPRVQALVAARLGHKSTLEETRTERLLSISRLSWPGEGQVAKMPIPLRFSGAHTHRLSGDWKLNFQNLPTRGGANAIRRALIAGPGESVLTVDASQIEARITAWVNGCWTLVEAFEKGVDVYSAFASSVFERPINRKAADPEQQALGFVGKTGVLGLGFGVGWEKFQRTVKLDSKKFTGTEILLPDEDALKAVNTYRRDYHEIPAGWKKLNYTGIPVLANGGGFQFGPCSFEKGAVNLPNGLQLKYHDLKYAGDNWTYTYGGKTKRIYGAALLENIVQALARIVTMDAAVRIQKRIHELGLWLNLQGHDELVYLVGNEYVETLKAIVLEEMQRRPTWAPELPLKAEVGVGASYGEAK
jgi:hypothetical protein